MIVAFPAVTPVTTPVDAFTVATAVLLLLHVPPLIPVLVNGVDKPVQTDAAPLKVPAFATGFTVTAWVAVDVPQPFETVYFMVAMPEAMPETRPVTASTVATDVLLLDHVPPLFPLAVKLKDEPTHTNDPPLMVPAFNTGFTVIDAEAVAVPQGVVTV